MRPECAVDRAKHASIGGVVFITSVFAALAGTYASYLMLPSLPLSIGAGLLWGTFIFFIDRYLIATFKKDLRVQRTKSIAALFRVFSALIPRLVLTVFVGIVIAIPLELRLLKREIEGQLAATRSLILVKIRDQVRNEYPEIAQLEEKNKGLAEAISAKQADRDRLLGLAQDELSGKQRAGATTSRRGLGPIYNERMKAYEIANRELDDLTTNNRSTIEGNNRRLTFLRELVANRQNEAGKAVDASDGLVSRLEALRILTAQRPVLGVVHYGMFLLFMFLVSAPILLIAMSTPGPYERFCAAIDRGVELTTEKSPTVTAEVLPENTPKATGAARDPYRLVGSAFSERYFLQEYAGGGGMGAVYRAVDRDSNATVAVKILKPDLVIRNARNAISFQREVQAARTLDHPNIVRVLDNGVSDDISFMVMEWLDGNTLEDLLSREQLSIPRIVNLFSQICEALITAHAKNIIHLDIKPANIFLIDNDSVPERIKVIDFGMARVLSNETGTTVTRFLGTYQYCSPEHFGGKVTYRSDIYSLGATLYHIIAGVVPFGTSYINAKMHPELELPPVPSVVSMRPALSHEIDVVIRKALSKNARDRQQSVRELLEEFRSAIGQTT